MEWGITLYWNPCICQNYIVGNTLCQVLQGTVQPALRRTQAKGIRKGFLPVPRNACFLCHFCQLFHLFSHGNRKEEGGNLVGREGQ